MHSSLYQMLIRPLQFCIMSMCLYDRVHETQLHDHTAIHANIGPTNDYTIVDSQQTAQRLNSK